MASGHKKRKAALVRQYLLNPVGLTNVPESERGVKENQDNLVNVAAFASGGFSPSIKNGSTLGSVGLAALSADGLATVLVPASTGLTLAGVISAAPNIPVYVMPKVGQPQQTFTPNQSAFVIYGVDGPESAYSPRYLTSGSAQTASLYFNMDSLEGPVSNIGIYVYGAVNSSSAGSDKLNFYSGSATTTSLVFNNSNLVLTSSTNVSLSASATYETASGLRVVFSSSAAQASSTSLKGWAVFVQSE